MNTTFTPSLIKLTLFLVFIVVVVTGTRRASTYRWRSKDHFTQFYVPDNHSSKPVYIIGTSRTMHGVNDSLLNAKFPQAKFLNAGMGYGTLISSAVIAGKIMERIPGSVLFIELSLANGRTPNYFTMMAEPTVTIPKLWKWAQDAGVNELHRVYIPFAENYVYDYIYLKPYLKLAAGKSSLQDYYGRIKRYESLQYDPGTFLKSSDLKNSTASCINQPRIYNRIISQLLQQATATNCQIFFFLPICMDMNYEKNRLICVFNQIPEQYKIRYTEQYLTAISKPEYLADGIHFNVQGAEVFTQNLIDFIRQRNNLLGSDQCQ